MSVCPSLPFLSLVIVLVSFITIVHLFISLSSLCLSIPSSLYNPVSVSVLLIPASLLCLCCRHPLSPSFNGLNDGHENNLYCLNWMKLRGINRTETQLSNSAEEWPCRSAFVNVLVALNNGLKLAKHTVSILVHHSSILL